MHAKFPLLITALATILLGASAIAAEPAEHKDEHKHTMAKDVDAFHAVIAPLWHAPKSKERSENVCTQTPSMENLAKAIQSTDAKALQTSVAALKEKCKTDPADIDAVFADVHNAFHHLAAH